MGNGNPKLDPGNQTSREGCPKADKKEHSSTGANHLQEHRRRIRRPSELHDPESNQHYGRNGPLEQKAYAGPPAGEGRKQSLQDFPQIDGKEIAIGPKRLKVGAGNSTFGGYPIR
jgi:hypothetical protein